MKRITLLILYLFLVIGCTTKEDNTKDLVSTFDSVGNETIVPEDNYNSRDCLTIVDENKKSDLSKQIIGEWYVLMGEYGNEVLSFSSDGLLTLKENFGNKQEVYKGTYQILDNKLLYEYESGSSTTSEGEINVDICGNILILHDWGGLYCRMGEIPNSSNEYSKKLAGYYFDGQNYYCFTFDGELLVNDVLYYYAANKDGFLAVLPAGASSGSLTGTFSLDLNNNIISIDNISSITYYLEGKQFPSLIKISYEEYQNNVVDNGDTHLLLVIADALKIRNSPSLDGEQIGLYFKGCLIKSDLSFVSVWADGYTWYKVFDSWITDKNGEWVLIIK